MGHRLFFSEVQSAAEVTAYLNVAARTAHLREVFNRGIGFALDLLGVAARAFNEAYGAALFVSKHCRKHMHRFDELVVVRQGNRLRLRERLLEFGREFILSHVSEFPSVESLKRTRTDV